MWQWLFTTQLPGGVPLWWAAAAGLYGSQGSTGSVQRSIADGTAAALGSEATVQAGYLLTQEQLAGIGLEQARALPGAIAQGAALVPTLVGSAYAPIHQLGESLVTPFRRADLPPVTGLEGLPTLTEMVADFLAGAQVPVASAFPPPWQPNPLLAAALGFLGSGIAKLWGLLNNSGAAAIVPWAEYKLPVEVTWAGSKTLVAAFYNLMDVSVFGGPNLDAVVLDHYGNNQPGSSFTIPGVTGYRLTPYVDAAGMWPQQGGGVWYMPAATFQVQTSAGWQGAAVLNSAPTLYGVAEPALRGEGFIQSYPTAFTLDAEPISPPPVPGVAPVRPRVVPAPAVLPAPSVSDPASPRVVPAAVPAAEPVVQPSATPAAQGRPAGRASAPVVVPTVAPTPAYLPGTPTTTRPLTNTGTLPLPAPTPTPTTPATIVVPWPGAKPIYVEPLAPPATIEGIAKKAGELEGKLDQIGGMLQPRGGDFDWDDVFEWLARLGQWLLSSDAAGSYEISSPCVATGEGSAAEPLAAEWPATIGGDKQIIKRLDALAELLQHHKTLKQPSCKGPTPQGEVVTVQFEET